MRDVIAWGAHYALRLTVERNQRLSPPGEAQKGLDVSDQGC